MNELEMEIGRNFGSSCFFVYQAIKHQPGLDAIGIQVETGLSPTCVWKCLTILRETNIVNCSMKVAGNRKEYSNYKENNSKETWKLH
jgi:hypothetical protein